jgi:hypothetical protein
MANGTMTFRNSKITYYGPHTCENCGAMIVKMGHEWGGTAFTNPEGPIYPNSEWHPHVCDPALVQQRKGLSASSRVTADFPNAHAVLLNNWGWVILGEPCSPSSQHALVISMNMTCYDTEDAAWIGALERIEKGYPAWHKDLSKCGVHARSVNELDYLPQMAESLP